MTRKLLAALLVVASTLVGCAGQSSGDLDNSPPPSNGAPSPSPTPPAQDPGSGNPSPTPDPTPAPPPPPEPTPTVCTSGTSWTSGNQGSSRMNPGLACISCHSQRNGPGFAAAGTLYPTIHEPDLCNGANGTSTYSGASVEIADAAGKTYSMSVNASGNFYLDSGSASIKLPIRATVTYQGKTRSMLTAQNSADCNSCHTEQGLNGAPGRVALP